MGDAVESTLYHVVHEGRSLGPFDRRTIVGMRVKKTLASEDVLLGTDGVRLTVAELVRQAHPEGVLTPLPADPQAPAIIPRSRSVVQGIHAATLLEVESGGLRVPPFKGEVEVRVQTKVLRISGRFREGLGWKEDRIKLPLEDIAHARLRQTVVDLWLRTADNPALQRVSLDLLTRESAGDLAESLPHAAPWPGSEPLAARPQGKPSGLHPMLWGAVVGTVVVVGAIVAWVMARGV
jgi:hypothetical protein